MAILLFAEQLLGLRDALEARLQSAEDERGRLVAAVMSTVGSEEESSVDSRKNQIRM